MVRVRLVTPAPFLAARELFASVDKVTSQVVPYQLALSHTVGIAQTWPDRDCPDELLGVIGFWPLGDGVEECFLACLGPWRLRRRFVPLQRAGRLIIRDRLHHPNVRTIVANVAVGNTAGRRLARLAGFVPLPGQACAAPMQRWSLSR